MTGTLIKAVKKDKDLVADMDACLVDHDHYFLWWLGQSGFLLQWRGKRVLLDPYLSDSLTVKYASTTKPHSRMSERVIDPALLCQISIVTSSHNHTDHLDAETLVPVLKNNPDIQFIIPEANREFVSDRVGCPVNFPIGLTDGATVKVDEFTIHGVPASHNDIERDDQGNCKYMGYVISFGDHCIYHSGDTIWYDGMVEKIKPLGPQLALLPINGNDPSRKVAGNLNASEAINLSKALGVACVIPCHYDMFTFNTADVNEFAQLAKISAQPFEILPHGGRYTSK